MDYGTVAAELDELIEGDVHTDKADLVTHSTDASIFTVTPKIIVYPKSARDIERVVSYVSSRARELPGLSITARAAGTCMSGGSLNESIILDVSKYMNSSGDVQDGGVINVQPGMYYRDFEVKTLARGYILPSYTASKNLCAVGGMIANNSSGERTLTFGDTSRYVQKLKVVLSDGNEYTFGPLDKNELEAMLQQDSFEGDIYRKIVALIGDNYELIRSKKPQVSKNSSGYLLWNIWNKDRFNLAQLMCGAQGTLGIITEATMSLVPEKQHRSLLVMELRKLAPLPGVVNTVLQFKPNCFETYDDHTFDLAEKFIPESAKKVITDSASMLTLIAEFTGSTIAEAEQQASRAQFALADRGIDAHIISDNEDQQHYWNIRRSSFALLKNHSGEHERTAPFIDDIVVKPEDLPSFLPRLQTILSEYKLTYTLAGHIGNGNFHLIPLIDMETADAADRIIELARRVFALVFEFGGSMAGEHNDGIIRTPFVKDMFGEALYKVFEQTKQIFDPNGMFNPGKKVGGTIAYAKEHMTRHNTNAHL